MSNTNFLYLIGQRIKEIRKQRGLTQEQLADRTDMQYTYIGGIERGERNISLLTFEKICNGLEVTPTFLFQFNMLDDEEEMKKQEILTHLNFSLQNSNLDEILLIAKIFEDITDTLRKKQ